MTLTNNDRLRIAEEAYKLLDKPYCLHGDSENTFNCSQFVVTVIKNALNIDLAPKADWLYIVLIIVKPKDLQIGDLVFFCHQPRPVGRIATHIAIYIGEGIEPIEDFSDTIINSKDTILLHRWLDETISLTEP